VETIADPINIVLDEVAHPLTVSGEIFDAVFA